LSETSKVEEALATSYSLTRSERKNRSEYPIQIDPRRHLITIFEHPIWPKNKTARMAAERIIIAFMIARLHAASPDEVDDLAFKLLEAQQ